MSMASFRNSLFFKPKAFIFIKSNTFQRQFETSQIRGSRNVYQEGIARVKMYLFITISYMMFWGPLFLETLVKWGWAWEDAKRSISHEVSGNIVKSSFFKKSLISGFSSHSIHALIHQPSAVHRAGQEDEGGHLLLLLLPS